jgi:hypothetical protein
MAAAQQPRAEGELEFIEPIRLKKRPGQFGSTEHDDPLQSEPTQLGEGGRPVRKGKSPLKVRWGLGGLFGHQKPALEGLAEERQIRRQTASATHDDGHRLGGAPLPSPQVEKMRTTDQAGGAVAAKGLGADQAAVGPGEGLLEHPAVTDPPQLGGSPLGGSQPAIEADRQDEPQPGTAQ